MTITRVAVVVPANNEAQRIEACLQALVVAAAVVASVRVTVLVVLDDCTDATARICATRGIETHVVTTRDVGLARAAGVRLVVADDPRSVWLACTDADSTVAPDWLVAQLTCAAAGADAVLGVVDVVHPSAAYRAHYVGAHRGATRPHPYVHGASMGLSQWAYDRVGGFAAGTVGEDQALADRLDADPAVTVVRSTDVRVTTSERRVSRVRGGFADVLRRMDAPAPV